MAVNVSGASKFTVVAEHGGAAAALTAGTEERTPLTELISDETGAAGTWGLKVFHRYILGYQDMWKRQQLTSRKLVVILLSPDADQYCEGVVRAGKSGANLETLQNNFAIGPRWIFSKVNLFTCEKPQYLRKLPIHALQNCCRASTPP